MRESSPPRDWLAMTFACVLLLPGMDALGQTDAPAPVPEALVGTWSGVVRHGRDSAPFALEFARQKDGRVLAKVWLAELNSYGSPVGFVTRVGDRLAVNPVNMPLELR